MPQALAADGSSCNRKRDGFSDELVIRHIVTDASAGNASDWITTAGRIFPA